MTGPIGLGCILAALAAPPAPPPDDVVMKAMRDELARSVEKLRLQSLDRPYFIAYSVAEDAGFNASASFGAALSSSEGRSRRITVELRVGDHKVDNTGYVALPTGGSGVVRSFGGIVTLPLDDDYYEIRRQIWLATDGAYKRALEDLSKKRAYLLTKTRSDDSPDFGEAQPTTVTDIAAPPPPVRLADLEALAKNLSAVFRDMPDVSASRTALNARALLTRYVNSEGTSFTRSSPRVSLTVTAATQADDGTPIEDSLTAYGRSLADLPPAAQLRADVVEMGKRLGLLRKAPHLDTYNGPVLFEGQAAAELFAQVFAPKLLATRRPILDDDRLSMMMDSSPENLFLDRVGGRVLPEGLSVSDDPTRGEHGGKPLLGGYKVDDEGVAAQETRVIENGTLKTLLTTRTPVRSLLKSTGNRRGNGPMPSNLLVSSEAGPSTAELKDALLKAAKERGAAYGVVVRRIGNPASALRAYSGGMPMMPSRDRDANRVENVIFAVKLFPDGREEPVRIAEIVSLSADAFKDVTAAKDHTVYTALYRPPATPFSYSAPELVSLAVPSLLFKEVSLRKPRTEFPKPPVLGPPSVAP